MSQLFEALKKIQKKENSKPQTPLPPKPSSPKPHRSTRPWLLLAMALSILFLAGGGLLYYSHRLASTPRIHPSPVGPPTKRPPVSSPSKPIKKTPISPAQGEVAQAQEKPPAQSHPSRPSQEPTPQKKAPAPSPQKPQAPKPSQQKTSTPTSLSPSLKKPKKTVTQKVPKPLPEPAHVPPRIQENFKKTYLLMTAKEKLEEGNLIQALSLYQRYIILDDSNAQVWNNIGAIYLRMGESQRALAVLRKARKLDPQDPSIQVNLAIALWEEGLKEEAGKIVDELTLRDDLNLQATYNLLALMIRMGRRKEAYTLLKQAEAKLGTPPLLASLHPYFRDLMEKQQPEPQAGTPTAPR